MGMGGWGALVENVPNGGRENVIDGTGGGFS